jgi:hypothetical protein
MVRIVAVKLQATQVLTEFEVGVVATLTCSLWSAKHMNT